MEEALYDAGVEGVTLGYNQIHHCDKAGKPRHFYPTPLEVRHRKDDVQLGWHIVHGLNEISPLLTRAEQEQMAKTSRRSLPKDICAFTGNRFQYGCGGCYVHLVPRSENFVPFLGLWLRVNGLIDCDCIKAEQVKLKIENLIPLSDGPSGALECGGIAFIFTLETARKLALACEKHLYDWAAEQDEEKRSRFVDWKPSELSDGWHCTEKIPIGNPQGGVAESSIKLFQCTMLVVHLEQPWTDSALADCSTEVSINRSKQVKKPGGQFVTEKELWSWRSYPDDENEEEVKKILPRPVTKQIRPRLARPEPEQSMPQDEPKLYLPFEPVIATLVFWKMLVRLRDEEGWRFTRYLQKVMKLKEWILILAESSTPISMWEREAQGLRPSKLLLDPEPGHKDDDVLDELLEGDLDRDLEETVDEKHKLPPMPFNPNKTQRRSHFELKNFDTSNLEAFKQRDRSKGPGVEGDRARKAAQGQEESTDSLESSAYFQSGRQVPAFDSWCGRRRQEVFPHDFLDGSTYDESFYRQFDCEHHECYEMIDAIEDRTVAALAVEANTFKSWVEETDLGTALRKLRCEPQQQEQEVFQRLKSLDEIFVDLITYCRDDCAFRAQYNGHLNKNILPDVIDTSRPAK